VFDCCGIAFSEEASLKPLVAGVLNAISLGKISGNASNQAEPMALLPRWVFARGYPSI
jgi:hypothetical protein